MTLNEKKRLQVDAYLCFKGMDIDPKNSKQLDLNRFVLSKGAPEGAPFSFDK